jgi:biopolymer transport protein ExbB
MDLNNLRTQIDSLGQQQTYISNLLGEYIRNVETQLHIAEVQAYEDLIQKAELALSNETLPAAEVFNTQLAVVDASVDRLEGLNGGITFTGQAVNEEGILVSGQFALIGPSAYFSARNKTMTGQVVEMLGSVKPTIISFENQKKTLFFQGLNSFNPFGNSEGGQPQDFTKMTQHTVHDGKGVLPIDTTLGDAHKVAQTRDTLWEHIQKGGIVMIPILVLAALALIVAVIKWIQLSRVKMPSTNHLTSILSDFSNQAVAEAKRKIALVKGPAGDMLQSAANHLHQPKELIEEVMYERMMKARTRMNKTLPFIAVCASSAPLLGLLGTVTGIINTFKLISAFGSGDAKTLSGGISEALVTTEFGLIVAIPSLLLHAFLSRKAKALIDRMESIAVAVINQITKAQYQKFRKADGVGDTAISEKEPAHG